MNMKGERMCEESHEVLDLKNEQLYCRGGGVI